MGNKEEVLAKMVSMLGEPSPFQIAKDEYDMAVSDMSSLQDLNVDLKTQLEEHV